MGDKRTRRGGLKLCVSLMTCINTQGNDCYCTSIKGRVIMQLNFTIVDFYLFLDGFIDMQI